MMRTMNIFSSSKREEMEILSRYRPIAPKPIILPQNPLLPHPPNEKTQQPITLKRSRKRSKGRISSVSHKKARPHVIELYSATSYLAKKTQLGLSLNGLGRSLPFPTPAFHESPTGSKHPVTLPLLPHTFPVPGLVGKESANDSDMVGLNLFSKVPERVLDLNCKPEIPNVKDLKLQIPSLGSKNSGAGNVIVPQAVRPVASSISVGCIKERDISCSVTTLSKRPEDVEDEVESEVLPSVVSDSKNKVRMVNSAYKELIGQPECLWLDSMVTKDGKSAIGSKRINGEVVLDLSDTSMPILANGFSCMVKIEWASNGQKNFINASCNAIRLYCEARDYQFTWKFLIPKF